MQEELIMRLPYFNVTKFIAILELEYEKQTCHISKDQVLRPDADLCDVQVHGVLMLAIIYDISQEL